MTQNNYLGTRVEVYWNLHRDDYSVRALEGPNKGRVIMHVSKLALYDVQYVVQPAGRAKVLEERRKNVHAFVRGRIMPTRNIERFYAFYNDTADNVTYNPYKYESFMTDPLTRTNEPIHSSAYAALQTGVFNKPTIRAFH